MNENRDPLYVLCREFIAAQKIRSSETIYQADRVIENAYDFIESVCNLVGYYREDDDSDA